MAEGVVTIDVSNRVDSYSKVFQIPCSAELDGVENVTRVGGRVSRTAKVPGTDDYVKVEAWGEVPCRSEDRLATLDKLLSEMTKACEVYHKINSK